MSRLTIKLKDEIIEKESNRKFYDNLKDIREKLHNGMLKAIKDQQPKVPKHLEKYMQYDNGVIFDGGTLSMCGIKSTAFGEFITDSLYESYQVKSTKEIRTLVKEYQKVVKEQSSFCSSLKQVMSSFTTIKKLVKEVPELEKHFNLIDGSHSTALVSIDVVNKVRKELQA